MVKPSSRNYFTEAVVEVEVEALGVETAVSVAAWYLLAVSQ